MRSLPMTGSHAALTGVCQHTVMTAATSTARLINRAHLGHWPPHPAVVGSELDESRGDQAGGNFPKQVHVDAPVVCDESGVPGDGQRRCFHLRPIARLMLSPMMMMNGIEPKMSSITRVDGSPSAVCHISVPRCSGAYASTLRGQLCLDLVHQLPQHFDFGLVVRHDAAQKVG